GGNSTRWPSRSSSRTVAFPTSGNKVSARQVTNKATRMPYPAASVTAAGAGAVVAGVVVAGVVAARGVGAGVGAAARALGRRALGGRAFPWPLRPWPVLGPGQARLADHQLRLEDHLAVLVGRLPERLVQQELGRGPAELVPRLPHRGQRHRRGGGEVDVVV